MKTNNLILLFIVAVSFLFTSCEQDNIGATFSDGGNAGVAFSSALLTKSMTPDDGNKIQVAIYRTNNLGTSPTVQLKLYTTTAGFSSGVFSLESQSVTFAEGSNVAYANIKYSSIGALSPTKTYSMGLAIQNKNVLSPSKADSIVVNASRKLTFANYGTGTFTSSFYGGSWSQPIQKAQEGEVYILPDCYVTGYPIMFAVADDGTVALASQNIGELYSATYGYIWITQSTTASNKVGKLVTINAKFTLPTPGLAFTGIFPETLLLP